MGDIRAKFIAKTAGNLKLHAFYIISYLVVIFLNIFTYVNKLCYYINSQVFTLDWIQLMNKIF